MTYDTDKDNDPFKISITLKDGWKRDSTIEFFEKGLGALLADEHFLLLYVPVNGAKMQIIQPARDREHRKRIIKRINDTQSNPPSFYYALSHLWGVTEENRYIWNDISQYVDDEKGQPVKPVSMRPEKRDTLLTMLKDHPDSYWWIDVLCARTDTPLDIMGNIYACCLECIAMIDCEPDLILQINVAKSLYQFYPESRQNSQHYDEKLPELIDLLLTLMQSQWWNRVWTWQEIILPLGKVRLMAETGTHLQGSTITVQDLWTYFSEPLEAAYRNIFTENYQLIEDAKMVRDWVSDISTTRTYSACLVRKAGILSLLPVLEALSKSTRQCMDPVDYVYGVLGIFQIKMPRMKDPNAIWQLFVSKLEDHMNVHSHLSKTIISPRAQQVDLLNVKNMGDAYNNLLEF